MKSTKSMERTEKAENQELKKEQKPEKKEIKQNDKAKKSESKTNEISKIDLGTETDNVPESNTASGKTDKDNNNVATPRHIGTIGSYNPPIRDTKKEPLVPRDAQVSKILDGRSPTRHEQPSPILPNKRILGMKTSQEHATSQNASLPDLTHKIHYQYRPTESNSNQEIGAIGTRDTMPLSTSKQRPVSLEVQSSLNPNKSSGPVKENRSPSPLIPSPHTERPHTGPTASMSTKGKDKTKKNGGKSNDVIEEQGVTEQVVRRRPIHDVESLKKQVEEVKEIVRSPSQLIPGPYTEDSDVKIYPTASTSKKGKDQKKKIKLKNLFKKKRSEQVAMGRPKVHDFETLGKELEDVKEVASYPASTDPIQRKSSPVENEFCKSRAEKKREEKKEKKLQQREKREKDIDKFVLRYIEQGGLRRPKSPDIEIITKQVKEVTEITRSPSPLIPRPHTERPHTGPTALISTEGKDATKKNGGKSNDETEEHGVTEQVVRRRPIHDVESVKKQVEEVKDITRSPSPLIPRPHTERPHTGPTALISMKGKDKTKKNGGKSNDVTEAIPMTERLLEDDDHYRPANTESSKIKPEIETDAQVETNPFLSKSSTLTVSYSQDDDKWQSQQQLKLQKPLCGSLPILIEDVPPQEKSLSYPANTDPIEQKSSPVTNEFCKSRAEKKREEKKEKKTQQREKRKKDLDEFVSRYTDLEIGQNVHFGLMASSISSGFRRVQSVRVSVIPPESDLTIIKTDEY